MTGRQTFIINLFGGPGTGKSTTAASLFAKMKLAGVSCELVSEYAKDLTWDFPEGEHPGLLDSMDLLAQQSLRQRRLLGKVDYVITDSPLPLITCFQDRGHFAGMEWFETAVLQTYSMFNNINVSLERVKSYVPEGRNQTEAEAWEIDRRVLQLPIVWTMKLAANEHAGAKIAGWIAAHDGALKAMRLRAIQDIKFNQPTEADLARVFGQEADRPGGFGETSGPGQESGGDQ